MKEVTEVSRIKKDIISAVKEITNLNCKTIDFVGDDGDEYGYCYVFGVYVEGFSDCFYVCVPSERYEEHYETGYLDINWQIKNGIEDLEEDGRKKEEEERHEREFEAMCSHILFN